jgi:hypothetical protein
VGPKDGLDAVKKKRELSPAGDRTREYNGKVIPVTGRGGPWACDTSRLPQFLDSRLTDGGEVVSLTRQPPFTPMKISGTHFC